MNRNLAIALAMGLVTVAVLGWLGPENLTDIYQGKLQVAFFSGFLTLAGFILSLKTNILLKLHSELFSKDWYRERVEKMAHLAEKPISVYGPLIDVGRFLVWTVLSCLLTSLAQVSVGFSESRWASSVCIGMVVVSIYFALMAWHVIRRNLEIWFDHLKQEDNTPK